MSFQDAPANTERAARLREFAATYRSRWGLTEPVTTLTTREGPLALTTDDLLAAANALDALGVDGYAAARVTLAEHGEDPALADVVLEAADTAADTLARLRTVFDDETIDAELDELRDPL